MLDEIPLELKIEYLEGRLIDAFRMIYEMQEEIKEIK